ncbi:MAG: response regulator transcription factor [Eubacteriales bacterium]|nr:response regulator transcription factor [Eubacteriales bacterium]
MNRPQNILIMENDIPTARILRGHLRSDFREAAVVFDSASVLKELSALPPDVLLLDSDALPAGKTASLCREIRSLCSVPVMLLFTEMSTEERIQALQAGADDYLQKPPNLRELSAKIDALWRRFMMQPKPSSAPEKCVDYPQLFINMTNYSVTCDGAPVDMPPKELELLYFLASSPNQVFTREQLLDHIWGYDYIGDSRTVDVHIKRIRAKIKDHSSWSLDTVWGVGYRFSLHSSHISSNGPTAPSAQTDSV